MRIRNMCLAIGFTYQTQVRLQCMQGKFEVDSRSLYCAHALSALVQYLSVWQCCNMDATANQLPAMYTRTPDNH
jgi:hypothetical protein